nr:tRNA (cytosine(32)/uridine(32)-2'-O)-methyltransferase TrmJ [Gammaproteobacteria bacterium]MCY4296990.1 tRNA (cytosine(32)/uridine(32)-2'-O)-methyltransferase TrmJ [Gammaproteobacteria bacterium]
MNEPDLGNISVVLVNTSHPGNIGASARAMKNMGLSKLALVGPKEFPSGVAIGRAASAVEILSRARVVDSLAEAVADCGLVIGASARSRRITWPLLTPAECGRRAVAEAGKHPVALVFGREDTGLSNEELQLCHYHVRIPANPEYPSLNLAAAVMVVCYELRRAVEAGGTGDETLERQWDQPLATADDLERFYGHLEQVLVALDFHDPENPRQLMQRLRRLFGRIRIDTMEMNILRGMLGHIEQELKNKR